MKVDFGLALWVKCINFHHTPHCQTGNLEILFSSLADQYEPVNAEDLMQLSQTGIWHKKRPGILPAFFNGYRNNYDVAFRLLEKVGLTGWFFIVTDCINLPDSEQIHFATTHRFNVIEPEYPDPRQVLSAEEIREISQNHIICSHTASHSEVLDDQASDSVMKHEILDSSEAIYSITGKRPPAFSWLLGEPYQSSPRTHPYLKQAGYKYLFGSRAIQVLP